MGSLFSKRKNDEPKKPSSVNIGSQPIQNTDPKLKDVILRDSHISQSHNGSPNARQNVSNSTTPYQATTGQKLWAAVILAAVATVILSPVAFYITSRVSTSLGGMPLSNGGPNAAGLLLHFVILAAVFWLIMW